MSAGESATRESAWIPGTSGLSLMQLWAMLWARKWIAIAVAAVIAFTTLGLLLAKDKTYDAFATVLVDYQSNDPTLFGGFSASLEVSYLNTQAQLISSRRIMAQALESLGWLDDPEARQAYAGLGGERAAYEDWLASEYLQDTWVSTDPESRLVHLGYVDEDPNRAATLVNALLDAYMASAAKIVQGPAADRASRFAAQRDLARSELEQAQRELTAYQQSEALIDISERVNAQQEKLVNLTARFVAAQSARSELQSRLDLLEAMRRRGESVARQAEVLARGGGEASNLRDQLQTLTARRAELSETLGPNHPRIVAVGAEIATVRRAIQRTVSDGVNTLKRELQLAQQNEATLDARVEEQRALLLELQRKNDQLDTLKRDRELAQTRYNEAVRRADSAGLASGGENAGVSVVRRAVPPSVPAGPSKFILLLGGCFLGGLVGLGAALLVELIWRRLRTAEDIEREWKLPVLAELPA